MASEITIVKIPSETVYPEEFAELERVSMATVRRWTTGNAPCLPIEPREIKPGRKRASGRVRIYYARWKEEQLRKSLGHSRFQIVIGA
ncbi:hypothetical protein HER17_18665 [Pectobacterium carotovorum]|uniref:hypothetical protein n=1 Tax=Pectobacterium TaxID=122277 RepID=UPI0001A43D96|nr:MULTISPECIES: hypothetical protein [Pectobacterium]MBN3198429.1 hypothetical protein [Pectobacterium brasiliense]MDK9421888.1 hypothetical protein [Pectobacterium carotovorum]QLL94829.1 hypothetical protein HER17_18665 [Pectobacterium carotovorum]RUR96435.1 hypothetical protein KHDHEBDM_02628 [Pectobacterium polaris]ULS49878.1 hypothetical protein GBN63_08825 [Pectobacterium carotovorum]